MLKDYLRGRDWRSAVSRWRTVSDEHNRTLEKLSRGESPDTPERQLASARRTSLLAPQVATESARAEAAGLETWLGPRAQERVIGRSADFEPGAFLELGLAVGRAVCLIEIRDSIGAVLMRGTAFLVSPKVVITNNHVLQSFEDAETATVTFDFRDDPYGRPMPTTVFRLAPHDLFQTSKAYDCTVVAVGERASGAFDLAEFGWIPLVGVEGKIQVGDPVNIIQHPSGQAMQWVLRDNRLLALPTLKDIRDPRIFAHYEADTLQGSSGAPVFSRLWEVIALHHQAIPAVDKDGRVLGHDDKPYSGDDESKVHWIGNEGVRVSALVRFLKELYGGVNNSEKMMLNTVLNAKRPDYVALAIAARNRVSAGSAVRPQSEGETMSNRIEFSIPLRISISIDGSGFTDSIANIVKNTSGILPDAIKKDPKPGAQLSQQTDAQLITSSPLLVKDRAEVLRILDEGLKRQYFDKDKSDSDEKAYYSGINISTDKNQNYEALSSLLEISHSSKFNYNPARNLYPWIDLHKDGRRLAIRSIYSGKIFDAREFIEEAFAIEARREAMSTELKQNEAFTSMSESEKIKLIETSLPYNCEHVVPQSWFEKHEPMRGDLHHLFACESKCNSFRGNHAYFDFPDMEATMDQCGRREEDHFEPISGKGAVARATFYFLVRYPKTINLEVSLMSAERITMLRKWNIEDSVSDYERHRNQAIFEVQGNRNPFIDHAEWADDVNFERGLFG